MLATSVLAVVLTSLFPSTQGTLPKMQLAQQALDGNAQDTAGPLNPQASLALERVWSAQGRRRQVWAVEGRTRKLFEEDFNWETALSEVEIDAEDARLFTLTFRQLQQTGPATFQKFPARIRVDDITDKTSPSPFPDLEFDDDEQPKSMFAFTEENKLLVVIANTLRVYDYDTGVLDPVPATSPVLPGTATGCTGGTSFVTGLVRCHEVTKIQTSTGERYIGIFTATVADSACHPDKPQPTAIVFCDLEDPGNPTWIDAIWQPCRVEPPLTPCGDWRVNDVAHVREGGNDLLYAVNGRRAQMHVLDVTDLDTQPLEDLGMYALNLGDNLISIDADPHGPSSSDYLYVVGQQRVYVVDRASEGEDPGLPVEVVEAVAKFGNGPAGTPVLMLEPDGEGVVHRFLWSLAMQNAPYVFRVTDFTQDGALPGLEIPDVSEAYYSAGPTDGAVAHFDPGGDSAYLATFGGAVRWDLSTPIPDPNPNAGSYQPGVDSLTGETYTIEHLELGDLATATSGTSDLHLVAPTAEGSFFVWQIDSGSKDPLPGHAYEPPIGYWPGWSGTYGNDVIVAAQPGWGFKWVLFDYSENANAGNPAGTIGVGMYNWTLDYWYGPPLTWSDPSVGLPIIKPLAQDIVVQDRWLFVGAVGGFLIFDLLTGLQTDAVYVNRGDVDTTSGYETVWGIEAYDSGALGGARIYASLGDPVNGFALATYRFDRGTGTVVDAAGVTSDDPLAVLHDGTGGDDFPGVFLNEGGRLSVIEMTQSPPVVRLYCAADNGVLVEVEAQIDETTFVDTQTPLSYWHNGYYHEEIMDCNAYKVPLEAGGDTIKIVVTKRSETFEIVVPPDLPLGP